MVFNRGVCRDIYNLSEAQQILSSEICPNLQIRGFGWKCHICKCENIWQILCKIIQQLLTDSANIVKISCNFANRRILSANDICKWSGDNWNWRRPFLPPPTHHHKILIPIYAHIRPPSLRQIYWFPYIVYIIYGHIRTFTPLPANHPQQYIDSNIREYTPTPLHQNSDQQQKHWSPTLSISFSWSPIFSSQWILIPMETNTTSTCPWFGYYIVVAGDPFTHLYFTFDNSPSPWFSLLFLFSLSPYRRCHHTKLVFGICSFQLGPILFLSSTSQVFDNLVFGISNTVFDTLVICSLYFGICYLIL